MSLFSSKKVYVASVLYNLAGDLNGRTNYLKSLVTGNVVANSRFSISETLQSGYMQGPGMKLRRFYRWALDNYDGIGVPKGSLNTKFDVDPAVVIPFLPVAPGKTVELHHIKAGIADYAYWADQWMVFNYPELVNTEWASDYEEATGDIIIYFEDGEVAKFAPKGFDVTSQYIYAVYSQSTGEVISPVVPGETVELGTDPFPDTSEYTSVSSTVTEEEVDLLTVVETSVAYSNDPYVRKSQSSSLAPGSFTQFEDQYERTQYMGTDPTYNEDRIYSIKSLLYLNQTAEIQKVVDIDVVTEDMGGGVTKTTTTKTTTDTLVLDRSYRIDTQRITHKSYTDTNMWFYQIGSGNAELDALADDGLEEGEYLPFIPLRLDNKFLSFEHLPDSYDLAKQAFKKATGGKIEEAIENIANNENLKDIDYAYVMFGVPLNTQELVGRKYLYAFFYKLMQNQLYEGAAYETWKTEDIAYEAAVDEWNSWKDLQLNGGGTFSDDEPVLPGLPQIPESHVRIRSTGTLDTNIDMRIYWNNIQETSGAGLAKPDAKAGDVWFDDLSTLNRARKGYFKLSTKIGKSLLGDVVDLKLYKQVTDNAWTCLTLTGLRHENYIYKKKHVEIFGYEALLEEDESGFLVPLHYETLTEMSLIDSNQLSMSSAFMVFNCYKVVKKKWYQTGIFKIITFVVIIAISVAFPPLGAGATSAYASIGAAIGLSGLAAVLAGAAISFLVTQLVMRLIGTLAIEIFGAKLGAIIGAVVGVVATAFAGNLMMGGSPSAFWGQMMSASNLISLSMAVGQGIVGYIGASIQGMAADTQQYLDATEKRSKEISELYAENIGYDRGQLDPLNLTDVNFGNITESSDTFLARTLMTGSDIAELSMNMLTNFADLTLSLDPAGA